MYKSFHIRIDWKKLRKELMEHGLQKELWSRLKYTWTDCYQLSVKPSSNRCLVGYEREKKERKKTRTSMNYQVLLSTNEPISFTTENIFHFSNSCYWPLELIRSATCWISLILDGSISNYKYKKKKMITWYSKW